MYNNSIVDLHMNRLKRLLFKKEFFADLCLISSTICIVYVIPVKEEYSISFFVLIWFFTSIIKEFNDADSS